MLRMPAFVTACALAGALACQQPAGDRPRGDGPQGAEPAPPPGREGRANGPGRQRDLARQAFDKLARRYDADGDGRITAAEYPRGRQSFANLDRNGDGVVTRDDLELRARRGRAKAQRRALRSRPPKVGDLAPDFELPMLGKDDVTVRLSSLRGVRPVALIFGSYT